VYIVSDKRMYRLSADRTGHPHIDREMSYRNSGIPKPSQVDASSGATPTIPPGGLVAITDNADPMDAVVYRTATRLRHHQHRVVCQVPVFAKSGYVLQHITPPMFCVRLCSGLASGAVFFPAQGVLGW